MGLNLIYAIFNGVIGFMNFSARYVSLAVYYLLLCVMRFLAVAYAGRVYQVKVPWRKRNPEKEDSLETRSWRVYRNCKILFSMMRIALGGAVIMLVSGEGGKSYQGLLIYAVATYTFYKLGMAIRNMIKVRKEKSLLLVILRNISYADALVSLLSLQTALFVAFGQDSGELIPLMNALTSAGVCLMILGIGIYMVRKSKKLQISYRSAGLYDVLKAKDLSDDEKLALVGDFDAVLSLSLLDKAAVIRDAQKATSEVHGDGEYVIIAPADATDEEQSTVRELLLSRYQARKDKNWAESDRIRDILKDMGIAVKDNKEGVQWMRG